MRQQKLAKFCQVILINDRGIVVESCNSIFNVANYKHQSISSWFPFIESIFPVLQKLKLTDSELLFTKVEQPASFLQGYYDFTFSKTQLENEEYLLWEIYDYTTLYKDFRLFQQKRNELEIQRQILALQNKKLNSKQDILNRQNITLETINDQLKNKNFISPLNALEYILSALKHYLRESTHNDYLKSLEILAKNIKTITSQFPKQEAIQAHQKSKIEEVYNDVIELLKPKNIYVSKIKIVEDIPLLTQKNQLNIKRALVGLILIMNQYYKDAKLHVNIEIAEKTEQKKVLKISIQAPQSIEKESNMELSILYLAIIKGMIESEEGTIEFKDFSQKNATVSSYIPIFIQ